MEGLSDHPSGEWRIASRANLAGEGGGPLLDLDVKAAVRDGGGKEEEETKRLSLAWPRFEIIGNLRKQHRTNLTTTLTRGIGKGILRRVLNGRGGTELEGGDGGQCMWSILVCRQRGDAPRRIRLSRAKPSRSEAGKRRGINWK